MKRVLFIVVFSLAALLSSAQDYKTSLGLRAGMPTGLSVKHFLSKKNAVEGVLAFSYSGFVVTGLYENEHWTGQYPGLNWFWGVGAYAGFWDSDKHPNIPDTYIGSIIGAAGVLGLEYTFDELPLNLSVDLMPTFLLIGHTGWGGINGALSVRYVF